MRISASSSFRKYPQQSENDRFEHTTKRYADLHLLMIEGHEVFKLWISMATRVEALAFDEASGHRFLSIAGVLSASSRIS